MSHQTSWLPRLHTDPVAIYHNLVPHPALSPVPDEAVPSSTTEQQEHEAEYRQLLVQGALAVLLPTEDLENACLRTLVTDVIADSILGHSVGGKVCEGWFLWGSIIKFADVVKARTELKSTGVEAQVDTRSRLETFGLVSEKAGDSTAGKHNQRTLLSSVIWRILQYSYLVFITIRFVILGFAKASSRPLRSSLTSKISSANESWPAEETPEVPRPILGFKVLPFISVLLNLPMRMPWLSGILALLQHHLMHGAFGVAATDGIIDQ